MWGEQEVSYGELAGWSQALASRLIELGVGPEMRVGVCLERTPSLVAGLLGILTAGGAYVPLDPGYPGERLRFLVEDSGIALVVTQPVLAGLLPEGVEAVYLNPASEPVTVPCRGTSDHLAYVIYTSGSTGVPKGVGIEHRSAVALVAWAAQEFSAVELSGVLASTSINFDLSVFELFVPLSRGGTVILAQDALELPRLAGASRVRLLNTVPSAMGELVRQGAVSLEC